MPVWSQQILFSIVYHKFPVILIWLKTISSLFFVISQAMYITQENAYTGGFLFIINVDRQTASSLQMSSGRVIFPTILLHTRLLRNSKNWDNTTLKTRQLKTRDQLSCGPSAAAGGSLYNFLPSWDLEIWLMEKRAQERYLWVTFYLQKGGKEGVI